MSGTVCALVELRPGDSFPVGGVVRTEATAELESAWAVEYRRCIAAWLIRQRSVHTRRAYERGWRTWLAWCDQHDLDGINPPNGTGGVFQAAMLEQGYKPATLCQWRAAIRQALLELACDGLRKDGRDPFVRVRQPKVDDVSTTVPLSDDEVHRVIEAATELGGKHRTAVLLVAVMGLRAAEAGQVCRKTVRLSPWGWVADITGKGGKRALVPVPEVVREAAAIDGWPVEGSGFADPYECIRWLVERTSMVQAGVAGSCHSFRHWHATVALREGVPLERVQDSLRHADPATTQKYNRARVVVEGHSAFTVAGLAAITGEVAP